MTRKLKSETSSQKIDVSADIIFGSQTLQSDFVILDLKYYILLNYLYIDGISLATATFSLLSIYLYIDGISLATATFSLLSIYL